MTSEAGGALPSRRLELIPGQAGQADDLQAALAAGARAQHSDGDLQASRLSFDRAYRLAEQAGDVQAMARSALGLAGLWVCERRTVTSTVLLEARLAHVLSLLDPRSPLALRVRTRMAGEADYVHGTHAAVLAALAEVRATADPELLAEALGIAHHCVLGPDHVAMRRDLAVELTKASFRTGRRGDLLMGLLWQTANAYCVGDPHAGRLLGELKDQLKHRNHLAVGFVVSAIDVMLAIRVRARPGRGGQGHPPGAGADHRSRRRHRRAPAPDGAHRRTLLLLARLTPPDGTGRHAMDRRSH